MHDDLEAFCGELQTNYRMNYSGFLADAAEAFGDAARIIVRRYDRASFEGGDIFHDFCAAAGILWDDGFALPKRETNPSLTFDVTESVRLFSKAVPRGSALRNDVLVPLARELSRRDPDPPGMTPFDEEATRLLMQPYLDGNRLIADRYLDGEPLFSDIYGGRPVWEPNVERIAEYRSAFEDAIRGCECAGEPSGQPEPPVRGLLKRVKRMLGADRRG